MYAWVFVLLCALCANASPVTCDLQEYRREMLAMCEHCQSLRALLRKMENGDYFSGQRSRTGGKGVCIPLVRDDGVSVRCLPFLCDGAPSASTGLCRPALGQDAELPASSRFANDACAAPRNNELRSLTPPPTKGATHSRREIEDAVLLGMGDHPTLLYIKALEDERDRYRLLFQAEVKKYNELRVAFRAQERIA